MGPDERDHLVFSVGGYDVWCMVMGMYGVLQGWSVPCLRVLIYVALHFWRNLSDPFLTGWFFRADKPGSWGGDLGFCVWCGGVGQTR